jgi:hypothetical protein
MNMPHRRNRKSDGTPRLGRPPGPSRNRSNRPWDSYSDIALLTVAANIDMERYRIAEHLGMSAAHLSNITCSPRGSRTLNHLLQLSPEKLSPFRIFPTKNARPQIPEA